MIQPMGRFPRERAAAGWLTALLGLFLVVPILGCDDGGGGENASVGLVFVDTSLRHPALMQSVLRVGLAMRISELSLSKQQAAELARIAREQGPTIRASMDEAFATLEPAAAKLAQAADLVVGAANAQQAMGQVMQQPDMVAVAGMIGNEGGPPAVLTGALDKHADLVGSIIDAMDVTVLAKVSGVKEQLGRAFGDSGELDAAREAKDQGRFNTQVDRFASGAVKALGYDPAVDKWAMDAARQVIGPWADQAQAERSASLEMTLNRLVTEVRPVEEDMVAKAARSLVATAAMEQAPDLLEKAAAK